MPLSTSVMEQQEYTGGGVLEHLDQAVPDYRFIRTLGHGAFGEVLLAQHVRSQDLVAVKQLYVPEPGAPLPTGVAREVSALQQLQHPNIISLLNVVRSGCVVYLFQELCCTDLAAVLAASNQQLPPQLTCRIMRQLLAALSACHAAGIMHRDVKPSNILITASGVVKLADFGQATCFGSSVAAAGTVSPGSNRPSITQQQRPSTSQQPCYIEPAALSQQQPLSHNNPQEDPVSPLQQHSGNCLTPAQGTRWYRAPELLFGSRSYGPEVDLWAAGMVFAEVLGLTPFIPGSSDIEQLAVMQHKLGSISATEWPGVEQLPDWHKVSFAASARQPLAALLPDAPPAALDLLEQLVAYNPRKRLTAAAALQHSYFELAS